MKNGIGFKLKIWSITKIPTMGEVGGSKGCIEGPWPSWVFKIPSSLLYIHIKFRTKFS